MHALAGIDHGTFGAGQQRRRFLHMHGVGAIAGAQHRRVIQRLRHFLVPHIGRDFHDDRPAAAVFQFCESAAENVADFTGEVDRLGRFCKRLHGLAGIEVRFDVGKPPRIAHRQHQYGHGFAVALRHATHGVFRTGTVLHAEGTDGAPRCDARDRVRHVQPDALLPHHYRADVGIGCMFNQVIDGIAAENLNSLALHDFRDGGAKLHGSSFPKTGRCWCRPVADSWNRILSIGKALVRLSREVLICVPCLNQPRGECRDPLASLQSQMRVSDLAAQCARVVHEPFALR